MPRFGPSYAKRGKDFDAKRGKEIGGNRAPYFLFLLPKRTVKLPSNEIKIAARKSYAKQSNNNVSRCILCVLSENNR